MGTKIYTAFQSDLVFELGQRDDLDSLTLGWVNAAYIKITTQNRFWGLKKSFYFPELETVDTSLSTADGTAYLTTPTTALIVRTLFNETSNMKLKNISWRKYLDYTDRDTAASEGKPTEWVRSGTKIYLHPTPDAIYNTYVYFRQRPTVLSASNTTTAIGVEWDEIILQTAVIMAHMKLGEFDKAKAKKEEWLDAVSGLIGIYDQELFDRKEVRSLSYAYKNNPYG